MRTTEQINMRLKIALLVVAILGFSIPTHAQIKHVGDLPSDWKHGTKTRIVGEKAFPSRPGICDSAPHVIDGIAKEVVKGCKGISFQKLYSQAKSDALGRAREQICPAECPRRAIETKRLADCSKDQSISDAIARVQITVGCFSANSTSIPVGVTPPQAGDYSDASKMTVPAGIAGLKLPSEVWHVQPRANPIKCLSKADLEVEHQWLVPNCVNPLFSPLIDRTKYFAELEWKKFQCEQGCRKLPFLVRRIEWDCTTRQTFNSIDVKAFVRAKCVRNP